jgi:hypothetical protein
LNGRGRPRGRQAKTTIRRCGRRRAEGLPDPLLIFLGTYNARSGGQYTSSHRQDDHEGTLGWCQGDVLVASGVGMGSAGHEPSLKYCTYWRNTPKSTSQTNV